MPNAMTWFNPTTVVRSYGVLTETCSCASRCMLEEIAAVLHMIPSL